MLEEQLKRNIESALELQGATTAEGGQTAKQQIVNNLARAIEVYTKAKLQEMKIALVTPGAFQGVGTGTVVITAVSLNTYNP